MIVLIILGVSVLTFLLCIWNNIYLVLAIFSDNLFISSTYLFLTSGEGRARALSRETISRHKHDALSPSNRLKVFGNLDIVVGTRLVEWP